ncbi:ATP-dependent DNA helicase PIF1-like [Diaphorina citri]|uniref:ATP-dependent DNA helicase n=1 Tax=Diaphorina citri TaxID=121845 RepID=A0A1S4ERA4_DIACI|nr:ATP-dependent DNA helicase PIF1-like [Diaphorina citri]
MRHQWRAIECINIDEISMVSYQMLCMIDSRPRQLKNKETEFFGGINVLLFGDLMQLPPIKTSGTQATSTFSASNSFVEIVHSV